VEFRILGPLEVVADGVALHLGTPRQRTLLGMLLIWAGDVVSQDRLLDDLWDEPPATARQHPAGLRLPATGYVRRSGGTRGA